MTLPFSRRPGRAGLAALAVLAAHAWITAAQAQPAAGGQPPATAAQGSQLPPPAAQGGSMPGGPMMGGPMMGGPGGMPGSGMGPGMMGGMPGPGMGPGMMGGMGPGMMRGMMGHGHHHGHHAHHGRPGGPFAGLVFRREDRQLTTAEVQRIAEALLLWQGERGWKVTEAREGADNSVEFALTTAEGGVIARFAMDRRTGRLRRIG